MKRCNEICQRSSRRKFIKNSFLAAGAITLSGLNIRGGISAKRSTASSQHNNGYIPKYIALAESGELEHRERALWERMESCDLCPRNCRVNRMAGRKGVCDSDYMLRVASSQITWGEERVIVGSGGAGSIFFSNCNLLCVFCQNWDIAHYGRGRDTTHVQLAAMMLDLQRRGAHNVGVVTPTHIVPHIVSALRIAIDRGLNIPLIYDTGGYETLEVIRLLDGIVDVYQPDFKFQDCEIAAPFLQDAPDYTLHAAAAIKEMHRQVGTLEVVNGLANKGLLIRHLVLPENLGGADRLVRWIVDELGADTHINIMAQYRPEHRARYYPPLNRRITQREFDQAMRWAREAGLHNFH